MIIVDAIETEFNVWLYLLIVLHEFLHAQRLNILRNLIKVELIRLTCLLNGSLVTGWVFQDVQILNFLEWPNIIVLVCVCIIFVRLDLIIILGLLLIVGIVNVLLSPVIINDLVLIVWVHLVALAVEVVLLLVMRVADGGGL